MNQEWIKEVTDKTKELMEAPSCCAELKAAAKRWLDAVGTDGEKAETKAYIKELEGDIMPLEMLIAFARSEKGAAVFGERAEGIAAHGEELQAAGEKYCDCPACAAAAAILAKKDQLLK